jgi:hypothetical protein
VPPRVAPDLTLCSLTVRITAAESVAPTVDHFARSDRTIEIFTTVTLPPDLVGKTIQATVKLLGDAEHSRWMIENYSSLP